MTSLIGLNFSQNRLSGEHTGGVGRHDQPDGVEPQS